MLTPDELKEKQRSLREGFPENLGLRVHRAISWLMRAEKEQDDPDVAFILLWVAFNASYAEDEYGLAREKALFDAFFEKVLDLDDDEVIADAIWSKFSGPIRILLNNKYVFQPYWNHLNGIPGNENWARSFEASKHVTNKALKASDTKTILSILFDRLYVLRNQLVHGGATWNSQVNRDQVRDGSAILSFLLPCFIDIMMQHPNEPWGLPYYPVVSE